MKRSREELEAELQAKAGEVIEELLDWHESSEAPTLDEIEDEILRVRKRLGEGMAETLIEDQEAVRPVPGPACGTCGEEMHYKGLKGVRVEGRIGGIGLSRAYYYCDRCRSGLFPPG